MSADAQQVAQTLTGWALFVATLVVAGGAGLLVGIYVDRRRCARQRTHHTTRSTS